MDFGSPKRVAQATLIGAREEVAALRALANAARLAAAHPQLLRLRELDAVRAFAQTVGNTVVVGGEEALLGAMGDYLPFAKTLALEPPLWMFAALVGCEGARLLINRTWEELSQHSIERPIVWLPETKIDAFDTDPVKHLRPMLDVLWNAAGLERSFSYDGLPPPGHCPNAPGGAKRGGDPQDHLTIKTDRVRGVENASLIGVGSLWAGSTRTASSATRTAAPTRTSAKRGFSQCWTAWKRRSEGQDDKPGRRVEAGANGSGRARAPWPCARAPGREVADSLTCESP